MERKYIFLNRHDIYAIYCRSARILYYNLDFSGKTQIILMRQEPEGVGRVPPVEASATRPSSADLHTGSFIERNKVRKQKR